MAKLVLQKRVSESRSHPFNVGLSLLDDLEVKGQRRLAELGQGGLQPLVAAAAVGVRGRTSVRGAETEASLQRSSLFPNLK